MRCVRRSIAVLGLVLLMGPPSPAFVLETYVVKGKLTHSPWRAATFPLPFVVSDRPLSLLPNFARDSTLMAAVEAALAGWGAAPLGMSLNGTVALPQTNWDGVNLITFADTPKNRDVTGNAIAVTPSFFVVYADGHARLVDTDVVFNPKHRFATNGRFNAQDVQNILSHELGHALGLDHSPIPSATMWPYSTEGDTNGRSPSPDDLAGVRALYDLDTDPGSGAIAGRVLTTADAPVFGAHVTATDADGITRVGAITDWDGNFTIPSLPAGSYRVHAVPLAGAMTPDNLGGAFKGDAQHPVLRDFRSTFAGGNGSPTTVTVSAGQATALDPIRVEAQRPTLNPRHWSWAWNRTSPWKSGAVAVQIPAGRSAILGLMGDGISLVSAQAVSFSGSDVTIDASGAFTDTSNNSEWLSFPFSVRPGARPGARDLYLVRGQERVILSGVLEITER